MAGFCTKCGRPLPENGICPCTQQQQRPAQPYVAPTYSTAPSQVGQALGGTLKNLPNLFVGYFRDPVGTTRIAYEHRDHFSGLLMLGLNFLLTLLGTLFFALIHLDGTTYYKFGDVAVAWIFTSILAPVVAFGITFALYYILAAIAKIKVDARGLLGVLGANSVVPAVLLFVTMLAGMISPIVFEIFAVLLFASWAIAFFTTIFQVLNIKMNIVSMFVLIFGLAIAFFAIQLLLGWFVYDGEILTFLATLARLA